MTEHFYLYNNKFYPSGTAIISEDNRSLRYGDGLFETMKMSKGAIVNKQFHFDRLFNGLSLLRFEIPKIFTASFLEKQVARIAAKNGHDDIAKIRLMVFRGNGGIFDPENLLPNYIIESSRLPAENQLNKKGLIIDVFSDSRKSCDLFSNLKSNNYLPYVMAGLYATNNRLDDSIVLNSFERVCDSAIASVFVIEGNNVFTPPLSEGCVAGTMRRWMLEVFNLKKYPVAEKSLTVEDILSADEFFLTNAISPIKWVGKFRDKKYSHKKIKEIYRHILKTI